MEVSQFAGYVLNIAEHDEIAITNHPCETDAYETAVALNRYFELSPVEKAPKVFGTTGDTLIVVREECIPEYLDVIKVGIDPRHVPELKTICGRQ